MVNDIEKIKQKITQIEAGLRFYNFEKKKLVKEMFDLLESIKQDEIIFDNEKMEKYHKDGIETYKFINIYGGIEVEYVFDVNAITKFIDEENIEASSIETNKLMSYIPESDQQRISLEISSGLRPIGVYKKKNPVILIGEASMDQVHGFVVNGNHRILLNKLNYIKQMKYYFIDYRKTPLFLLNNDYKKLYEFIGRYKYLIS